MKKQISIFLFIFISSFCFSENFSINKNMFPDNVLLRHARIFLRDEKVSEALRDAEKAKLERKKRIESEIAFLEKTFRSARIKRLNGDFRNVISTLEEMENVDALSLISFYMAGEDVSAFHNSTNIFLSYIKTRETFPEADFIIGKIYSLEGEFSLAKKYFLSAWNSANALDVEAEEIDILYELANLSELENDLTNYEKYLLLIVRKSALFADAHFKQIILVSLKNKNADTMEKFFTLYRSDESALLKSFDDLSRFYEMKGENEKAIFSSALSALVIFTKLYDVEKSTNLEFSYENFKTLWNASLAKEEVRNWINANEAEKKLLHFASLLEKYGNENFANLLRSSIM